MTTVSWLDQEAPATLLGGKGANLSTLLRAGFPVPNGFVVTTDAYHRYLDAHALREPLAEALRDGDDEAARALFDAPLPDDVAAAVVTAWHQLGAGPVAVRSSGTAEDQPGASFAGQQDSFLNVHGDAEVCDAVRRCFRSLWNERAIAYRARRGIGADRVAIAVVVQQMVPADAAGVLFTTNPTNGRSDQVLLTAAPGLGETVVQGGAADVVAVEDGRVIEREVADKATMVVTADQGTREVPVPDAERHEQAVTDEQAVELAALGLRVAEHLGGPQDVEWVVTSGVPVVVQARPVTASGVRTSEVPDDWGVPDEKGMYVRASIVEQMPDPLSPLFADMVRPAVTGSLHAVLGSYFDEQLLHDGDIDFPTVNGYAYYHYSRDGLTRLLKHSPQAVATLAGRSEYNGEKLWNVAHPTYQRAVAAWAGRDLGHAGSTELLDGVAELLRAGCDYYTSVQAVIPLAASAELPFVRLYEAMARTTDAPPATTFLLGYPSRPIQAEQGLYDLAQWARGHRELADTLLAGRDVEGIDGADEFARRLDEHLARHGHTVYNLDFMVPTPADDPTPVLETLRWYLSGKGTDPAERLAAQSARRDEATAALFDRLDPARTAILKPLLAKAQHLGPLREDALADVGLAWPVMRRMLHAIGSRLVDIGVLADSDDVFWLHHDELVDLCRHLDAFGGELPSRAADVEQRRATWRGQRAAVAPQLLPRNAWHRMFHRLMPAMDQPQTGPVIKGLGASQGRVTAPVRIVRGPEDFGAMMPGEVLVSPITTPAWTPLFAMAAAVVTDVGGPLSHSSIVAREYGIPAVLGTGIATRRLRDGMLVTVDGDRGEVAMPHGEQPLTTGFKPRVPYKFAMGAAAAVAAVVAARWR